MGWFSSLFSKEKKEALDKGLEKTKTGFFDKLTKAILGKSTIDDEVLDNLEEVFISADIGTKTSIKLIERIEARVKKDKYTNTAELDRLIKDEVANLLEESCPQKVVDFHEPLPAKPYVIMVVGVNGVGKTTTIGKLAAQFHKAGKKVVLGAADTFRAAAVEQLKIWGERSGVPVIEKGMNADPASVAYSTVQKAIDMEADVVIIDTAGRLQTKIPLMQELGKIKRVIQKINPTFPHEILLVLDGATGQNAIIQAQEFMKVTDVNALAITKLDGTAKGGVVIAIADIFKIPVKYIGVGEKIEDLQVFNHVEFVDSLFKR
ncbi:MAG: signal recognition particle-docking protein FtsY [Microscillaceae bacterium]|nr:signal recognition particle-docking protein FtsY [Microscillaceae bacterium]MDW8461000.1 signal recognition particle-docking protein FtsY [Cytophagales bacterium]